MRAAADTAGRRLSRAYKEIISCYRSIFQRTPGPPLSSFNVVWRAALKSERFSPRLRLIERLRVATRPDAIKSRFGLGPIGTVGERSWP
jgi:hypothetical protein